jgi:hypothetical protein
MQPLGIPVALCFESGTTFCLLEKPAHFVALAVALLQICHGRPSRSSCGQFSNTSSLLLETYC